MGLLPLTCAITFLASALVMASLFNVIRPIGTLILAGYLRRRTAFSGRAPPRKATAWWPGCACTYSGCRPAADPPPAFAFDARRAAAA